MDITLAGSAVTYTPNDDELTRVSLEFAAFDGEIGTGQLPVPDSAAALTVAGGRAARVNEIATRLTDGFIIDADRSRGPEKAGSARVHGFGVSDANALLSGFRVTRTRSAETDYARVMAFAALDGATWDTTWVLNASTVTLPAKKYDSDGGWDELITDVVEFTGKTLFLHDKAGGGRCLHYHLLTNGHTCGLTITDAAGVADGITSYVPQQPVRQRTSVDLVNNIKGRDQAGRTTTLTDATSIAAHDADGLQHQALIDFETTSQSDLNAKTAALLATQKDERDTYTCAIGPLDASALALIRVGDLIGVTSTIMGLTASTQRIAHMTLSVYAVNGPPAPGLWLASLELGAPVRRRARVKLLPDPTIPPAAVVPFVEDCGITDTFTRTVSTPGSAGPVLGTSDSTLTYTGGSSLSGSTRNVTLEVDGTRLHMKTGDRSGSGTPAENANYTTCSFSGLLASGSWIGCKAQLDNPSTTEIGRLDFQQPVQRSENLWKISLANCGITINMGTQSPCLTGTPVFIQRDDAAGTVQGVMMTFGTGLYHLAWEDNLTHSAVKIWADGDPEPSTWDIDIITAGTGSGDPFFDVRLLNHGYQVYTNGQIGSIGELYIDNLEIGGINHCNSPLPGQTVLETVGTGDNTTTFWTMGYPYMPSSLMAYVNNLREFDVAETDPAAGTATFGTAPFTGEVIRMEYRAS